MSTNSSSLGNSSNNQGNSSSGADGGIYAGDPAAAGREGVLSNLAQEAVCSIYLLMNRAHLAG